MSQVLAKKIFRNEMKLRDVLLGNCGTRIILTPPDKTLLEVKVTGARFSKVPVTFRARSYILKLKSIEIWRSF